MAVFNAIKDALGGSSGLREEEVVPNYVEDNLRRAEERIQPLIHTRNLQYEFWRGDQYAYTDSKGLLKFLPTKTTPQGGGKRPWQSRAVNNLLIDIVAHEVSSANQRIPSYEVVPTSVDPDKRSAAHTSSQVALYGYDKWGVRNAFVKLVTHAVVGDEGFIWPYFDNSVGPMIFDRNGQGVVGQGEVRMQVYGPNECMWEPGVRFEDSYYHVVRQPRSLKDVTNTPGFYGRPVTPDAKSQSGGRGLSKANNSQLVMVYEYLEKPTKSFPKGRWLSIANGRVIAPERPYPAPEGDCIFPLAYITDPDNDRDMGLVKHLIDPQRIYNDAWNKIVEWKNLALNPQMLVAPGVLQGQIVTPEPGAIYEISDPKNNFIWREVPDLPQELFQIAQEANQVIARIAAQNDIPQQVEAGRAIQTLIERDQNRRQAFTAQLAEVHAKVASRGLQLVQEYYTEPRLLRIKGRWAWETIKDFRGADLSGQVDVRVSPGSIEPRTKAAVEQKVLAYADRGWITPQQAMSAIEGGYAGDIIASYELDVGRATRIIARLKEGEESLFGTPEAPAPSRQEIDPVSGQMYEVPDFMPRKFDNVEVQMAILEDWMKTEEFESLEQPIQSTAMEIYQGMELIKAQKVAQAAMVTEQQAEDAGAENAARGSGKPMPDAPSAIAGGSQLPTPNQPPNQSRPTE